QESAYTLATWLEGHPRVRRVLYPSLASHPQHDLAHRQMSGGGTVVTFEIDGGTPDAFAVLDALELIDISNNLGDAKSLVTHPATTTHRRLGPEIRQSMGITDGIIRVSVGLESVGDLQADLEGALG
ncbi:MAG: O-succinylhomoserine sulfhydrylase, partial [Actinobacteria bacterium]|nr:O-succinylhomoserine sulfhydrylase [Actinomycetota bacterium]